MSLVYGKDDLHPDEARNLKALKNLHLYFMESLHAKCYCNEQEMIITSMNMYEFSERSNREMGVLISRANDQTLYEDAFEEIRSIVNHSKMERGFVEQKQSATGFCIRCSEKISHNPEAPYCNHCYRIWTSFGNPEYTEKVCHTCGRDFESSMNRPECNKCYRKSKWH